MKRLIQILLTIFFLLGAGNQSAFGQWDTVGNISVLGLSSEAAIGDDLFLGSRSLGVGESVGGIFRSTDGGLTWNWDTTGIGMTDIRGVVAVGNTLFAGTTSFVPSGVPAGTNGLYRSTNLGASWERIDTTATIALAVDGNTLYVEKGNFMQEIYLLRTRDQGLTWDTLNSVYFSSSSYINLQYFPTISIAASGGTLLIAQPNPGDSPPPDTDAIEILSSKDSGNTWTTTDTGFGQLNVSCVAILGSPFVVGTFDGLFRSTDFGATWLRSGTGIGDTSDFIEFASFGNELFAATLEGSFFFSGPYLSTDFGVNWTDESMGDTIDPSILFVHGTDLYVVSSTNTGGIIWRRSLDQMLSVQQPVTLSPAISLFPNPASNAIHISTTGPNIWSVSFCDLLGREVARFENPSGPLDVSRLEPGRYEAVVHTANGIVTEPLIVQH